MKCNQYVLRALCYCLVILSLDCIITLIGHYCAMLDKYSLNQLFRKYNIPRGLTARIAGSHPAGPGSTPGVGSLILYGMQSIVISHYFFRRN